MLKNKLSIVVIISGSGSNLQAMIDRINAGYLNASISAVISSSAQAYGIERAKQANIPTHVIEKQYYHNLASYDLALAEIIEQYQPQLIVLAGFMRILGEDFVKHFYGRLINIHPALLPAYPGLHTHERVLQDKKPTHGTSIHFVDAGVDTGPIIAQAQLQVLPTDDAESLKNRVQKLEYQLYPYVIQLIAEKRIQLIDDKVFFDNNPLPINGLQLAFQTE